MRGLGDGCRIAIAAGVEKARDAIRPLPKFWNQGAVDDSRDRAGTCATCCSQPPRARVRQWGLIRGIGPVSKSPWSPRPDLSQRRRQSTRMNHNAGKACGSWDQYRSEVRWTRRWSNGGSNHRSLSCNQYPKKAPELCAQGQPRCVRTVKCAGGAAILTIQWFDGDQRHARTLYRNPTRCE